MPGETTAAENPLELIYRRLDRARRAWRVVEVLGALLRGTAFLLAAFLLVLVADNLLRLPGWVRMALGVGFLAAATYALVIRVIYRALRPLTDEMVAAHVERSYPELDNRLINAVLLQKERFEDPVTRRMVASQLDEATQAVRAYDLSVSTNRKSMRKWAFWTGGLAGAVLLYALVFSNYFVNALRRYAAPHRFIAPITDTILTVLPGNAELLQGDTLSVEAHIEGVLPEKAYIEFDDGQGGMVRKAMPFEGGFFSYEFAGVQRSFSYRVSAGDAISDTFKVAVRTRPTVRQITLTYAFPAYMGLPERSESSQAGHIRAPVGTTVKLVAVADRPIDAAYISMKLLAADDKEESGETRELPMTILEGHTASASFVVERSGQYQVHVQDTAKIPNQPVVSQIVALPDEAPRVRVIDPGRDVAVEAGARIALLAEAKDDFRLHELALFIQRSPDKEWEKLRAWSFTEASRETREGAALDLKEIGLKTGDVLSYYFQGADGCPGRDPSAGRSRVYQVAIVDAATAHQKSEQTQEALRAVIRRLIAMQKSNLAATGDLRKWVETELAELPREAKAREPYSARAGALVKAEEEIYSIAVEAARSYQGIEAMEIIEILRSLAAREITRAVEQLEALRTVGTKEQVAPLADAASKTQEQIIALLERALQDPKALAAERLEQESVKEKISEKAESLADQKQLAEKMREAIRDFQKEQQDVLKMSKQIKDTPVNDFTPEDQKNLEKIVETEQKWAKYFQETATDLSKLPPQDFSLANMAKEYSEIFAEVQKAAKAAEMKAMEIAVPLEQSGLELAKSIETNIEKWLMEVPDRLQWKMEDPVQDYDVPLVELPDELEDIIGDLLEQEEDLLEEAADATSGWLDSMDKGVGWGTMDGPISDMSAKGVTGNVLPDSHEVGGRSGEGRTGKSSGQFVEESATGKGGRNTPTRLTQDPFEAGVVKDTSSEPATGSTGGGKASGVGQEGLRGQPPAHVQQELKRVAQIQQQLIDKAERLDHGLKKYNYPRGELPKTIELMQEIKRSIQKGDIATAGAQQKIVLKNLKEVKDLVQRQKQLNRDNSAILPPELREEIIASREADVPEQYKELVDSYFRALAESGSGR